MKYIKQLFGLKDQVKTQFQATFNTVGTHQLPYEEWCKELRVSMLHGRTVVYMD